MAVELKQTVKLSQQLLITPQLQQAIKLLQLSRLELVETVQKELLENPVLEESEERDMGAEGQEQSAEAVADRGPPADNEPADPRSEGVENREFDWGNYVQSSSFSGREPMSFAAGTAEDAPNYENMISSSTSLHDHLEWQVKMGSFSPEEEETCITLIGNLDDNGYLQMSLEELAEKTPYSFEELEDALCIVQDLDPPGVGARGLQECLLLQIKDFGEDRSILEDIIKNHLKLIERRNFQALSKKLDLTIKRTKELCEVVYSLEPKPGRAYGRGEAQYITPDVYIQEVGDEFVVILNEDGLPKLQISNFYKSAIMKEMVSKKNHETVSKGDQTGDGAHKGGASEATDDQAQDYIHEKLKSALWLIKSIHQRQKTLFKVTKSIAGFQKEFMASGVQNLKPLVLRDVAEEIGVHESTVSRATNGKYVHTPQGIFELKYFFNTGLSNSSGGEDFANEAVKQMIRQLIGTEDQKAPLSDQALTTMLKRQNIDIARRTVAKYREMLGILPSSRRKRLY
ncbi:MAG: RNA polymerase factor sigma-54 [Deltaproteobacteria bacterium]|nr:RNA polymerase factor sigma-54 [Deltaproteobacteria bacterium]